MSRIPQGCQKEEQETASHSLNLYDKSCEIHRHHLQKSECHEPGEIPQLIELGSTGKNQPERNRKIQKQAKREIQCCHICKYLKDKLKHDYAEQAAHRLPFVPPILEIHRNKRRDNRILYAKRGYGKSK